jgi:Protein of unknown function (DUF4230)
MGVVKERRRERTQPEPPPPAAPPTPEEPRREWSRWAPGLVIAGLLVVAAMGVPSLRDLLPSFPNPFASETVDRSGPAVLQSIQDLSEYRAASGHFEVVVDLERDSKLPSDVLGERILFVGVGDVDASVDFSRLEDGDVTVSDDRRTATIVLPQPRLEDVELDLERSYVYDRSQGVLNEIGNLFQDERNAEREVYLLAEDKIAAAARANEGVTERARRNTREMLTSLLRSLGFTRVEIVFEPLPAT